VDIKKIAEKVHRTAESKGWWDENIVAGKVIPRSIGDQFANFHSEISEAWELYRDGKPMDHVWLEEGKPEGIGVELADCIIRILDTCEEYKIDIAYCLKLKMKYNETRPYRHGGKLA
jgi:NTP pyrophosphatase (non-canonical NTP hydrolase)